MTRESCPACTGPITPDGLADPDICLHNNHDCDRCDWCGGCLCKGPDQ